MGLLSRRRLLGATLGAIGLVGAAAVGWRWRRGRAPTCAPDLRDGGALLVYDLDLDRAIDERVARDLDRAVDQLRQGGAVITRIAPRLRAATLDVQGLKPEPLAAALAGTELTAATTPDGGAVTLQLEAEAAARIADAAMQQAARVVRRRLAPLLPCPPTVKQVESRLVVGLPAAGPAARGRVRGVLGRPGRFEIREIDPGAALAAAAPGLDLGPGRLVSERWPALGGGQSAHCLAAPSLAALLALRDHLPPSLVPGGMEALVESPGDRGEARLYLVQRRLLVAADELATVEAITDPELPPGIKLRLQPAAAARFATATARLRGRKLALVLDGRILAAPLVMSAIDQGSLVIDLAGEGEAGRGEAEELAAALRGGPLPAPLVLSREESVGPAR